MKKKPNILFFFADDQRYDTIASLGNPVINTPNLDQLVREGTSFTHAHIPGGTVDAVCMPSRAMLHTGRNLFHLERNGSSIPEEHALLGETLKRSGYRTVGIGKWHNGKSAYARSFTDGGEIFFGGMTDHWNVPAYQYDSTGLYDKTLKVIDDPVHNNHVRKRDCDHIYAGKHSSELFCEFAAEWLRRDQGDEPWFMYISLLAPHDPRSMPDRFKHMYDPESIELPPNYMDSHPFPFGVEQIRDELLASSPRDPLEIKRHIAEYYGMISHLDDELGKVIVALKLTNQYDNTIIVFAADNGLAVGQHGLMGKQSAYEHSVRVPLIFAGPGLSKNETREDYVYLSDLFPTFCDMLKIPIPQTVEGISLLPALQNIEPRMTRRESLYFTYADLVRAVKHDQYKLIEYRDGINKHTQLFDLKADPWELNNLYDKEEYALTAIELQQKLLRYRDEWDETKHPVGSAFWSRFEALE